MKSNFYYHLIWSKGLEDYHDGFVWCLYHHPFEDHKFKRICDRYVQGQILLNNILNSTKITSQGKFDWTQGPTTYWKNGYKDWLGNEKHNEG